MRITVNDRTVFRFPTCLIINTLTAGIIRRKLKKYKLILTRKQTMRFIKELKRYKKSHSDWYLVEASEKNGDTVRVKI